MSPVKERWLIAALDAISQFRAAKTPLKNLVSKLCTERNLGAGERKKMREAAFAWSRSIEQDNESLLMELKQQGVQRPTLRQLDEAIIQKWLASDNFSSVAFPEWFTKQITKDYGLKANALLESLATKPKGPTLALDVRHISADDVCEALKEREITFRMSAIAPNAIRIDSQLKLEGLPKKIQRHVWFMEEASQLAASFVQPKNDDQILDCCAGAGGKTKYLVSRHGRVSAMDISERRLLIAKNRCDEAFMIVADARYPPFTEKSFEWILLDAPCTGSGTIQRAPDLLQRMQEGDIERFVQLQREILKGVVPLLKPGGTIVYVTCSLFAAENGEQAQWAQDQLGLELLEKRQLLPYLDGTDGFFIARLIKR